MNQRDKDEPGLKNLSDEELETVCRDVELDAVGAEITLLSHRLQLAIATEEVEFRKSGKSKRSPDDWGHQWFDGVTGIAAAHQLEPAVVWEIARKVEAKSKCDFRS
jgi:hypothetical protein